MVVDDLGHTKVRYFDSVLMNQNIFGLDIPMDYVLLFEELQSDHHLSYEPFDHLLA